jgi:hypothetical protein
VDKIEQRLKIRQEAIERIKSLSIGDQVTNICAGDNNPMLHCFFVEYKKKSHTSKFKVKHTEHLARCTDKKGKFWNIGIEVIYPGWLDEKMRNELFGPVWEAHHNR